MKLSVILAALGSAFALFQRYEPLLYQLFKDIHEFTRREPDGLGDNSGNSDVRPGSADTSDGPRQEPPASDLQV